MAEALHPPVCVRNSNCSTLHITLPSHASQMLSILWHDGAWMCILCIGGRINGAFLPVLSLAFWWISLETEQGPLQQQCPQQEQASMTWLLLPTFRKPISGFDTHDRTVSLQGSQHIPSKHNTFRQCLPLLFKMFRARNVSYTVQWELSHSW